MACVAPDSHDYQDIKDMLIGTVDNPFKVLFSIVDTEKPITIVKKQLSEQGDRCEIAWRFSIKRGFTVKGQTIEKGTFDLDGNLKKIGDKWLIVGI